MILIIYFYVISTITGVNPCSFKPCLNGGNCIWDTDGDYTCECLPAYEGATCERGLLPSYQIRNAICSDTGVSTMCEILELRNGIFKETPCFKLQQAFSINTPTARSVCFLRVYLQIKLTLTEWIAQFNLFQIHSIKVIFSIM